MAVRLRITSIPLMFLLLCSALLATTLQGVQGEVEVEGPSESECRPYIEKALKKLETGDAQSADVQDDDDDITHIVTTDDSDTQSGEAIESIEPKSVEEETQEVEDEQDASEKHTEETESVEVETAQDEGDTDETDDTQEVSAEQNNDTEEEKEGEQADAASEEKDGETEEAAESAEKEASVEGEHENSAEKDETEEKDDGTEEQKSTEEAEETGEASIEDDTASVEQEGAASVEEGAASVEEAAASAEESAASAEQEDAANAEQEGAASAEQEDAASAEQEGASVASEEQEEAGASVEEDEGAPSAEEEAAASAESNAEQEGAASVEEGTAASAEEEAASIEQEGAASAEQEGEASTEQEGAVSAEQEGNESTEEQVDHSEEKPESTEQGNAPSAETEVSAEKDEASTEKDEASAEKDEASAEKDEASAEKDEASPEKDGSAEQVNEAASAEKEASDEKKESTEGEQEESAEKTEEDKTKEEASAEAEGDADSKQESAEKEQADEEAASKEGTAEEESEEGEAESTPEEDLTWEVEIPSELRPREHVNEILNLNDEPSDTDSLLLKAADKTLNELKKIYENAIKPLETLYKYRDLSNRHFGDPEIFSKPLVLFMGPWSGGKSSIINYLLENEYTQTSLRTGAEPSPAYFNLLMHGEEPEVLDGTQLAADWTFSGLQKFGQGLEERLRGLKLPNKLLEKINIVEIPGILEVRKQVSRMFPFNDACQWFIDRADIIFLVYDPSKLDVGPETEAILDQLKGREYQTRIILNKADQVKPEELMRVQGALIWNISPLMSSAQPPVMYSASLWSKPYEIGAPVRLLQAQERAFLKDLKTAIDKRIENKIASARRFAVRVRNHAKMVDCYLTTYYNHKSVFGNKKLVSDQIIEHPQDYHIYEGLSTLTNISRYDLPDPDVYRDFFRLNPLYDFQQLSATCTYFRGCPINRLDVAIAYDLPELVGKYKKMVEPATNNNADSSTKS